jgi:hypothetical protein
MATSSLLGRRIFLAAASRTTQRQIQATALRANSSHAIAATTQASYQQQDTSSFSNVSLLAAAGATLAATTAMANDNKQTAKCCGIAGVVGAKGDARDYLIEGLTILKNRGYDSAGIATMDEANPNMVSCCFCAYLVYISCLGHCG